MLFLTKPKVTQVRGAAQVRGLSFSGTQVASLGRKKKLLWGQAAVSACLNLSTHEATEDVFHGSLQDLTI